MKKVLLMNQQGAPYETSPARYQLVHELKREGYETYVFNLGEILRDENRKDIDNFINTKGMSKREMRRKVMEIMPEYIIVSTDDDMRVIFTLLPLMKNTSFIYYNLEIYTPEREQGRHRGKSSLVYPLAWRMGFLHNKVKEIIFTKKCKLFTIQDNLRKKISSKYYIGHSNTLLIPNSYIYNTQDNVESGCCGVVYSGILTRFRMEPLIKKLHNMPNFPIVFSGSSDEWSRKQFRTLRSTHPDMILCEQRLSPQKHLEFIKKYAVGFVWYDHSVDDNEENIGMASGKFFRHLSIGQPVIVSETPGLAKTVDKYKLGIVIKDISELPNAYDKIMKNYSQYQNNIRRVYKKKFDFAKNIKPFLESMENF